METGNIAITFRNAIGERQESSQLWVEESIAKFAIGPAIKHGAVIGEPIAKLHDKIQRPAKGAAVISICVRAVNVTAVRESDLVKIGNTDERSSAINRWRGREREFIYLLDARDAGGRTHGFYPENFTLNHVLASPQYTRVRQPDGYITAANKVPVGMARNRRRIDGCPDAIDVVLDPEIQVDGIVCAVEKCQVNVKPAIGIRGDNRQFRAGIKPRPPPAPDAENWIKNLEIAHQNISHFIDRRICQLCTQVRWNLRHGSLNGFCRSESMGRWNRRGRELRSNSHLLRPRIWSNRMRKDWRINQLESHLIDDVIRNTPDDPPDPVYFTDVDAHVTNRFCFNKTIDVEPLFYCPGYSAVFSHPQAPIVTGNRQGVQDAFITNAKNRLIWFIAGEISRRFNVFIRFIGWRDQDTHVTDGIKGLAELDLVVLHVRGLKQFPFTVE